MKNYAEKKEEEEPQTYTSFYEDDYVIAEEIYPGIVNFAIYDKTTGAVSYGGLDKALNTQPIQATDDTLAEGAVLLPTKAEEYDDIRQLVDEIQAHIHRYLDISRDFEAFATCYVLLSWVYDRLTTLCYLRALGDTGCGKSRFLDVIGRLCYKPMIASGCITPAPIYRMIRRWRGTLVLDEADFKNSDEYNEVITILNCGFEQGKPVLRCQKDAPDNIQALPTYGPKIMATRRRFKDPALESRCLTEILRETSRKDIPPLLPKEFYQEEELLRNKLLMFRFRYRGRVNTDDIKTIDLGDVEPRLKQATSSFAVLLSNVDGLLDDFLVFLRKFNSDLIEQRSETLEGKIITSVFALSQREAVPHIIGTDGTLGTGETLEVADKDAITSSRIKEAVRKIYGDDLTAQKIGGLLRGLGLETEQSRHGKDRGRYLKWDAEKLEVLRRRYVPCVPSVPSIGGTPSDLGQIRLDPSEEVG